MPPTPGGGRPRCGPCWPHMTLDAPTDPVSTPLNRQRVSTQWSLLLPEIANRTERACFSFAITVTWGGPTRTHSPRWGAGRLPGSAGRARPPAPARGRWPVARLPLCRRCGNPPARRHHTRRTRPTPPRSPRPGPGPPGDARGDGGGLQCSPRVPRGRSRRGSGGAEPRAGAKFQAGGRGEFENWRGRGGGAWKREPPPLDQSAAARGVVGGASGRAVNGKRRRRASGRRGRAHFLRGAGRGRRQRQRRLLRARRPFRETPRGRGAPATRAPRAA